MNKFDISKQLLIVRVQCYMFGIKSWFHNVNACECACIKCCFEIGKYFTETFELIKLTFEDISLSYCVTFD